MKYSLVLLLLLMGYGTVAQKKSVHNAQKFPVKGRLVTVTDWGSRSVAITGDFFKETAAGIIKQIGKAEFDKVKLNCGQGNWPEAMRSPFDLDSTAAAAHDARMNQLKMYKICSFQHKYNGKLFERYAILRVPYAENSAWNTEAVWSGNTYFLLHESDTKPVKKP